MIYVISDRDRVELPLRGGGSAVIPVSGTHVDFDSVNCPWLGRSLIDERRLIVSAAGPGAADGDPIAYTGLKCKMGRDEPGAH
jgi:hypothetical protein